MEREGLRDGGGAEIAGVAGETFGGHGRSARRLDFGLLTTQLDPDSVRSREDFVAFVRRLAASGDESWAQDSAVEYLDGLAAWVDDTDRPLEPSWRDLATILLAATTYE